MFTLLTLFVFDVLTNIFTKKIFLLFCIITVLYIYPNSYYKFYTKAIQNK